MRWLLGLGFAMWGCGQGNLNLHGGPDGGGGGGGPLPDAFNECSYRPPDSEICGGPSCGNGTVDVCYVPMMQTSHCTLWFPRMEVCDTTAPEGQTCDLLGYYGGSLGCNATCTGPNAAGCGVCAPGITCVTPFDGGTALSVSGTHTAALDPHGSIQLYAGTTPTTLITAQAFSLAATDAGWLIRDNMGLQTLAYDGTFGPVVDTIVELGPGPENRVTGIAENNSMMEVRLLDQTGGTVTTPVAVFAGTNRYGIATDGVHAFVGGVGTLALLALDGTATTVTGFPADDALAVTWDGTTGWYVTATTAQRFASTGALVGSPIALSNLVSNAFADRADLVTVFSLGNRISTQRIHADGSADAPVAIGAGSTLAVIGRIAGQLVVNWNTGWNAPLAIVP